MVIALVYSQASFAGKKQCKPYLDKLHNIQSQQKQGHSLKRSNSLNKQEAKTRKMWWQCERGLIKKVKNGYKKKKKSALVKRQKLSVPSLKNIPKVKLTSFQTSAAVVVKSHYQGEKLHAWLQFYQQPKKCFRPKTTKQFAFCVEDKITQQLAFESGLGKNDVTDNIK
jgi:hypothetical protein